MSKTTAAPDPKRIRAQYKRHRAKYDAALLRIEGELREALAASQVNFAIKGRVKGLESYLDKIQRLQSNGGSLLVNDMLGLRVVSPFLEEIESVKELIAERFTVIEEESKSAEHSFREFGYDSIHLLISLPEDTKIFKLPRTREVCEIQLRTILQDAWAEVEHELIYKADFSLLNEPVRRKLASLNATLTLSDIIFQEIRDYQKEVQQLGEKRRAALRDKIRILDRAVILSEIDSSSSRQEYARSLPVKPKSKLERLIFDALEAHSNAKYGDAIAIYSSILAARPHSHIRSIVHNHRGMAYFAQSKYKRAVEDFTEALACNPENIGALNNRGLTHRLLRRHKEALSDFDNSLELNRYQAEVCHSRALTHHDLGDMARALEDCQRALDLEPGFGAAENLKTVLEKKAFSA